MASYLWYPASTLSHAQAGIACAANTSVASLPSGASPSPSMSFATSGYQVHTCQLHLVLFNLVVVTLQPLMLSSSLCPVNACAAQRSKESCTASPFCGWCDYGSREFVVVSVP